jgi:hypothetical protein
MRRPMTRDLGALTPNNEVERRGASRRQTKAFHPNHRLFSVGRAVPAASLRSPAPLAVRPLHPCSGVRRMRLTLHSPGIGESCGNS